MENDLGQQLLQFPFKKNLQIQGNSDRQESNVKKTRQKQNIQKIKKIVLGIMVATFVLYRVLHQNQYKDCIVDLLHQWTEPINILLNENNFFYQVFLIITQQSIQINIFLLCIISTWRMKNLKAQFFIGLFYGTRAILLNIERFPYPPGIRWDQPFVPSITVPYGITRDYFYSGHTGFMLFCTLLWHKLGYKWLYRFSLVLTPFVMLVLICTRVHYSIDIVAAIIFTVWFSSHILPHVIVFDKFFSFLLNHLQKIIDWIIKIFR